MRINANVKFLVVGKNRSHSDKTNKDYFSLAVVTDAGEAGNISCTEECFNSISETFKNYEVGLAYNDQYRFMNAVSAHLQK